LTDRQTKKHPPPLSFRLTDEERTALQKAAAGLSLSDYIRSRLFGPDVKPRRTQGKFPVKDHAALARLLGQFGQSRIANNLNQLAKAVNTGSLPVTPETEGEIKRACEDIGVIRSALIQALGLSAR
jgi:hypothetical protein